MGENEREGPWRRVQGTSWGSRINGKACHALIDYTNHSPCTSNHKNPSCLPCNDNGDNGDNGDNDNGNGNDNGDNDNGNSYMTSCSSSTFVHMLIGNFT